MILRAALLRFGRGREDCCGSRVTMDATEVLPPPPPLPPPGAGGAAGQRANVFAGDAAGGVGVKSGASSGLPRLKQMKRSGVFGSKRGPAPLLANHYYKVILLPPPSFRRPLFCTALLFWYCTVVEVFPQVHFRCQFRFCTLSSGAPVQECHLVYLMSQICYMRVRHFVVRLLLSL